MVLSDVGCCTGAMTDVRTSRLRLHAIEVAEGERIVAGSPGPGDAWADDFPFEVPVDTVRGFLRATAAPESYGRSAATGSPAWPTGGPSG